MSSGGYATLAALAFHDAFAAGVNLYGMCDLISFVKTTHKFERHYIQSLVGAAAHDEQLLWLRSPLSGLENISAPLLTLQGTEDKIVPPSQSQIVMQALREKGVPCAYLGFHGEGHGFRHPGH